ncbi:MAG: hypothetical protein R3253_15400, partial [Longimicrobiales bacterium]|nr:hypothetical protein [Longimicrobiales bacterium]
MSCRRWVTGFAVFFGLGAAFLAGPSPASAQTGGAAGPGSTLTPADYDRFERLGSFELGPDGQWLVAAVTRVDGDGELRLHRADGSGEVRVFEHGRSPEFSADGRWMAYRKGVSAEERESAESPVHDRLGLVDLSAGTDTVLFEISSFDFRDDGAFLAARGVTASDSVGADLLVLQPASGSRTVIGNVDAYEWQDGGGLLAATLLTSWGSANGVVVFDPDASVLRTLDSGDGEYVSLTWSEESDRLAVLRSVEAEDREEASHDILVWEDAGATGAPRVLSARGGPVDADTRITPFAGITFSSDGRSVFVGVRPWEAAGDEETGQEPTEEAGTEEEGSGGGGGPGDRGQRAGGDEEVDDAEPADVQVWHWDDDQILRAQEYRAAQISRRTHLAAWHLDADGFVVLGDDL